MKTDERIAEAIKYIEHLEAKQEYWYREKRSEKMERKYEDIQNGAVRMMRILTGLSEDDIYGMMYSEA